MFLLFRFLMNLIHLTYLLSVSAQLAPGMDNPTNLPLTLSIPIMPQTYPNNSQSVCSATYPIAGGGARSPPNDNTEKEAPVAVCFF